MPQYPYDLQPVFQTVFNRPVRQIESLTPAHAEQLCRLRRFSCPVIGSPARSSLALGQVEDRGAQSARSHAQQRAATGLFHVVAVRRNGKYIGSEGIANGIGDHWRLAPISRGGRSGNPPLITDN
jgi:hypothetical protein